MSNLVGKIAYRPIGFLLGAAAGGLSGLVFKQVWKRVTGDDEAPGATDEGRGWGEVLVASAIQGAIFAAVKAAVERGGATGIRRVSGRWPA